MAIRRRFDGIPASSALRIVGVEMLKIFHDLTAKVSAAATRVNVDVSASCFGVMFRRRHFDVIFVGLSFFLCHDGL